LKKSSHQDFEYVSTWKDTYANLYANVAPHIPLAIEGFNSDYLYRQWLARQFDLGATCPGFYNHEVVPRRHISELGFWGFVNEFERRNSPVILQGVVDQWPAYKMWTDDYLRGVSRSCQFRATSGTCNHAANFTVQKYLAYAALAAEEVPLYLFDKNLGGVKELQEAFTVPPFFAYNTPSMLEREHPRSLTESKGDTYHHATDLFSLFEDRRPDFQWLIMGPRRSGSIFHIDPNQTHAWNASIRGRKKWIFYPPGVSPPGVRASPDGAEVLVPLSTGEWLLSFWRDHLRARKDPISARRPLECVVNPGEMIFVPHNWWHMVINLDDCIALTQNYVSSSNLADCLRFLKFKPEQISGVRDGAGSDKFADNMYSEFVSVLEKRVPEVLENADVKSVLESKSLKRRILDTNCWSNKRSTTDDGKGNVGDSNGSTETSSASSMFTFSFSC
jgi:hypothetical protein